jgi:hypothetical protein
VIVADTGAILGLLDSGDRHHRALRTIYDHDPDAWVLPWAILPEVDYLVGTQLGGRAQDAFLDDLATGAFAVEWGHEADLREAQRIAGKHRDLRLGLVDAVVMAVAERLDARAIATLDLRHFGAVTLKHRPRLLPRDA